MPSLPRFADTVCKFLCVFVVFILSGCSTKAFVRSGLEESKAIIIMPRYMSSLYWVQSASDPGYYTFSHRSLDEQYVVAVVEPGTYYLRRISQRWYVNDFERSYASIVKYSGKAETLGNIDLVPHLASIVELKKTPELQEDMDMSPPAFPGQGQKTEQKKTTYSKITSYYIASYDVMASYGYPVENVVASFTVGPNDIVLLPGLSASMAFEQVPCNVISKEYNDPDAGLLGLLLGPSESATNKLATWEWRCLASGIWFKLSPANLAQFKASKDATYLPPETLGRIRAGEFERGVFLQDAFRTDTEAGGVESFTIRRGQQ